MAHRRSPRRTAALAVLAAAHPVTREVMAVRSSADGGRTWQRVGKVVHWGPSAYFDLVDLGTGRLGLLYEAGQSGPYESIRFARFDQAYLDTPNGTPPGLPEPPEPGPTTPDRSGHHNDGYVRGAITDPAAFDGTDDHIAVPWSRSLDLGAGDFTWTARIRYTETTGIRAILWAYRVGSGAPQIWLRAEPANHRVRGFIQTDQGSAAVDTTQAYDDGAWHDVSLRRAGGRLTLTVDGQATSVPAPAGSVTEGRRFTIDGIDVGRRLDGADAFRGSIADVRIRDGHGTRLWLPLDRIDAR